VRAEYGRMSALVKTSGAMTNQAGPPNYNTAAITTHISKEDGMANHAMEVWRIFSKPDGTSSMEKVAFTLEPQGSGWSSPQMNGKGFVVKRLKRDMQAKWHTAPRRQMGYTIYGEGEIETGDGQKLVVRPGVVTLLEDLTGKGHLTRGHGEGDRMIVFTALDDDVKVV